MKRIVFVTPSSALPGFQLAGMEQLASSEQTIIQQLPALVHDASIGLIVLDERLSSHVPDEVLARFDRQQPGKVTILPAPYAGESSLALEIIRQAIGYHVRISG